MRIKVTRDTLTPDLRRRLRRVRNPEPALRAAGLVMASMAQDAFTNESVRPSAWDPLKPSTLARKAAAGYGSSPLIASGTLARSPRIVRSSPREVVVGSDRRAGAHSLAAIHQLGAPKAHIPPRPFFPFRASGEATETAKRRIRDVLLRWLGK